MSAQAKSSQLTALNQAISKDIEIYQNAQKDVAKAVQTRSQLESQLRENDMVIEELNLLEEDANVFKQIGPALIKQDLVEAKSNVSKRLDYIKAEMDRLDGLIKGLQNKVAEKENEIIQGQKKLQAMSQAS